jgi:homocysteine S-methyltransferase
MTTAFAALLAAGEPILLDGGLATQCEAMGHNIDDELWSASLLRTNPQAIVDATRAFLDAGSRIVASASYQASRQGLEAKGVSPTDADELIRSSVTLARQACIEFMADNPNAPVPLVAASIGPYGAILHDGSEYTGNYAISADELRSFHEQRLAVLDSSDADLLACETIPCGDEAIVLAELLQDTRLPSWVCFSCRDAEHLADGTPLVSAAGHFNRHPRVAAVGANCVAPDLVIPLIATLRTAAPEKAIAVYPNSGETYTADDNSWHGTATPLQCEQAAADWIKAGATLVGGCCRIGPEQIAAMSLAVKKSS